MSHKILLVDDEADVLDMLSLALTNEGYDTIKVNNGAEALQTLKEKKIDLIILDIMMPGMSGTEVCKQIRKHPQLEHIPIIILTAKSSEIDRVLGLELGADDYVIKPFSPRELVLRVKSILRRGQGIPHAVLQCGPITIDRVKHTAHINKTPLTLTATEFSLLATLVERKGTVLSREILLNDVWGYETIIDTRTVDTHMRRLREKLGKYAEMIETIRGVGYRLSDTYPIK
ncbi:MAG: response regulator transcription factor [Verrucomicrobiae bacterium]|nr:response regulator transcription factor [Verrucomicrobiae bacterium]